MQWYMLTTHFHNAEKNARTLRVPKIFVRVNVEFDNITYGKNFQKADEENFFAIFINHSSCLRRKRL